MLDILRGTNRTIEPIVWLFNSKQVIFYYYLSIYQLSIDKTLSAENYIMNKKLKDKVSSAVDNMNGEFIGLDDKVNDKVEAAENALRMVLLIIFKK